MTKRKTERAHNDGSEFTCEGRSGGAAQSAVDQFVEFADKAVDEVSRVGKTAFTNENAPKLAAGAALGAVAAAVVPLVSLPLGALAGLGYVAYRQANKSE